MHPGELVFRSLTATAALLLGVISFASGGTANVRVCQAQEQKYEQIKSAATTLEVNAALFSAADKRCVALARRLLQAGASLQARDRFGANPLSRAAKSGDAEIVELFLENGAAVDARDLDGSTALFLAAETGRRSAVQTLVAHGANVNLPGRSGIAPVAAAAFMGDEPLVRLLLDKGADANAIDATGKSAICYAASRGFPAVVQQLLDSRRRSQQAVRQRSHCADVGSRLRGRSRDRRYRRNSLSCSSTAARVLTTSITAAAPR